MPYAVLLTFSRQYPPIKSEIRPHALLVALELDFSWKTIGSSHSTSKKENRLNLPSHPFSQKLSLPFRGLLDNVIRRCIIWQCLKYILFSFCYGFYDIFLKTLSSYIWLMVSGMHFLTQASGSADKYRIYSRFTLISNLISKHRTSPQFLLQSSASWTDPPTNPSVPGVISLSRSFY
jgi:hypothetical protein